MLARLLGAPAVVLVASTLAVPVASAQSYGYEQAVLVPTQSGFFGASVDLDGTRLVVGAPDEEVNGHPSAGATYVYEREPTCWHLVQRLTSNVQLSFTDFGESVALAGDTLVVGGFGVGGLANAEVFTSTGGSFTFDVALPHDPTSYGFGHEVAIDGDTIAVGAPVSSVLPPWGEVYVYVLEAGQWTVQDQILAPEMASDTSYFGSAIGLDGDTMLVGSSMHDAVGLNNSGQAYVYVRSGSSWVGAQVLSPPAPIAGGRFGISVALDGDSLAIGASQDEDGSGVKTGAVYVYVRSGAAWSLQQKLTPSDGETFDLFGISLDIEGDRLAVGASEADSGGVPGGAVYWYQREGTMWTEEGKLTASTPGSGGEFGLAVVLEGETLVAGSGFDPGAAYVLASGPLPTSVAYCTAGTSASGCAAALSSTGLPSATSPTGFALVATGVEGSKDGLYFFGTNGRQANPWGSGTSYQCAVPPVVRAPLMAGSGTSGLCDGSFALDLNALWCPTCPKPAKNPGAGTMVQAQLWYRDPLSTSNQSTSLSDALEFCVGE